MTPMEFQQSYSAAVQHHVGGRLREAEAAYRQLLAQHPGHPDLTCMLGVLSFQTGNRDAGLSMVRQAVAAQPNNPEFHSNLGGMLSALQRSDEAINEFAAAIAIKPASPDILYNMAMQLRQRNRVDEAISAIQTALVHKPIFPEAYCLLGDCLSVKGDMVQATASFKKAIAQGPNGGRMPVHGPINEQAARIVNASLWPEYQGPPIDPKSGSGRALNMTDAQAAEPTVHPDLAYLENVGQRDGLPTSLELFSLDGEKLPCWREEDLIAADGDWLRAPNLYPFYYALFQKLAPQGRPLRVLEIGVRTGYVGVALAKALQTPAVYVGLDPNLYCADGLQRAAQSLARLRALSSSFEYFLMEGYSWNMPEKRSLMHGGPYDIIHIDGDHTLPGKLIDLELSRLLVAPGGYVLVDDYDYIVHRCVKQAVSRVLQLGMYSKFGHVPTFRGMAVLQV